MEKKTLISWVLGAIAIVAFIRYSGIYDGFKYIVGRECIKSHEQKYLQAPMTINVGGGKYGGGVGVPLGGIEEKTRTVCDEYTYNGITYEAE